MSRLYVWEIHLVILGHQLEVWGTVVMIPRNGGTVGCHCCTPHTTCKHREMNLDTAPSYCIVGTVGESG